MSDEKIKNLVICSTLNQITNYLIIKKYKPERIFNITFDYSINFNINMKPEIWDKYLKEQLSDEGYVINDEDNIHLSSDEIYSVNDIENAITKKILNKISENEEIYWNITGGQRTIALAISDLIKSKDKKVKNRKNDKVIYIEGNTEKLIINNYLGEYIGCENYDCNDLTFKRALHLAGFDTKNLNSTILFKTEKQKILNDKNEYKFYKKLYKILCSENEKLILDGEDFIDKSDDKEFYHDTFRNLLLKSNIVCKKEKITQHQDTYRKKFIKVLFKKLIDNNKELKDIKYYNENLPEIKKSYPAGYIFEKITAYKIYDLIKTNPKIIRMATSLKTYFKKYDSDEDEKEDNIIDEIDIVLLTNTGKIINFECKSGGMDGDNAKSTKYTTYRLSGVFGMPILLSPLYESEKKKNCNNEFMKNQLKALRSAEAAELEVFTLDGIESGLKRLGILK